MTTSSLWTLRGTHRPRSFTLNNALWCAEAALAFVFFYLGSVRAMAPIADVATTVSWVKDVAMQTPLRAVGAVEIVLALGVLVPPTAGFKPHLSALCSYLLGVFAACALALHVMHGEVGGAVASASLCALALFAAWGRAFRIPHVDEREDDEHAASLLPRPGLQG